jgi:hypothetical protein
MKTAVSAHLVMLKLPARPLHFDRSFGEADIACVSASAMI